MGALHYQPQVPKPDATSNTISNGIEISAEDGSLLLHHRFSDFIDGKKIAVETDYEVHQAGVLSGLKIVDTTGAGDAFIGGYLMAKLTSEAVNPVQFALEFGSWVGGRKLEGPGARCALPKGMDVDKSLGTTEGAVAESLKKELSTFNNV